MTEEQEVIYSKLLNDAFRFVSYRPRSQKEIINYLKKRIIKRANAAPNLPDEILARLKELGYADDEKFVSWWISQRSVHNVRGPRVIKYELAQKGVSKSLIEKYISENYSEKDTAVKALSKKMKLWSGLPVLVKRKKIYEYLSRRGFDLNTISTVIDEAVEKDYNMP